MYLVVSFPGEDFLFIVPYTWISEDKCYWPPYKTTEKVKKAALQNETPDPQTWTCHPVVLKVKDTYEKAHDFYLKAKRGETLQTDEDIMKRKRKPNMKFSKSNEFSDEDERSNLPPAPKIPRVATKKNCCTKSNQSSSTPPFRTSTYPAVFSNQAASHSFENPSTYCGAPPQQPSTSPLFLTSSHGEFTSQAPPQHPSQSRTPLPAPPQQDFYRLVLQHLWTIEEELKEVKQQVAVNTSLLQKLGGGGVADLCLVEDTNMPLSNVEDLEELERRLASDMDMKNQLVKTLAVLGGKTSKDAVKRMLGRVFRKSLALKVNWTGAGGKVAFKSLHLKSVLHRTVRRVVPTATEEELQKEVALYLKGAADREGGRKDRRKNVGNGDGEVVN